MREVGLRCHRGTYGGRYCEVVCDLVVNEYDGGVVDCVRRDVVEGSIIVILDAIVMVDVFNYCPGWRIFGRALLGSGLAKP